MQIAVYKRLESGQVTHHGVFEWPSVCEFFKACHSGPVPPLEVLLLPNGFSDLAATWAGQWGVAVRPNKPCLLEIELSTAESRTAAILGNGDLKLGVSKALALAQKAASINESDVATAALIFPAILERFGKEPFTFSNTEAFPATPLWLALEARLGSKIPWALRSCKGVSFEGHTLLGRLDRTRRTVWQLA